MPIPLGGDEITQLRESARKCRLVASVTLDERMAAALLKTADDYVKRANRLKEKSRGPTQ